LKLFRYMSSEVQQHFMLRPINFNRLPTDGTRYHM
jgi:hypothetical protein